MSLKLGDLSVNSDIINIFNLSFYKRADDISLIQLNQRMNEYLYDKCYRLKLNISELDYSINFENDQIILNVNNLFTALLFTDISHICYRCNLTSSDTKYEYLCDDGDILLFEFVGINNVKTNFDKYYLV